METIAMYGDGNNVIIVNKCDVDKYEKIGFSLKKATKAKTEPKKSEVKPEEKISKVDELIDEKKRSKK